MNKKFKALIAGAMAVASAATMVISASAYKPTTDQAAYEYLNVKGNAYVLNQSTINNFPEITRSLVNSVKSELGTVTAELWSDAQSSSGRILGVFSAGVSLNEAYDIASQTSWYDVDGDRIFPALKYNKSANRYYLVNAGLNGATTAAQAINYNFKFCPKTTYKDTRYSGKYSYTVSVDVAIAGTYCLPNIKITGTDKNGNALKHILTLENGDVVSKWVVQYGASGYARFSAKLYDTAIGTRRVVKSVSY